MALGVGARLRPRSGCAAVPTRSDFKTVPSCRSLFPRQRGPVVGIRPLANEQIRTDALIRRRRRPAATAAAAAAAGVTTVSVITTLKLAFVANPVGFVTSVAACVGAIAFAVVLVYAIPALVALRRTMEASEILVESLQDELPDALAAMRLSGLELTDAIEEISGLGSDLSAGLRASARALVGAEGGVREGAQLARDLLKDGTPLARRAAERALLKRSKLNYSEGTVASVARGAKVASKRVRFALAAAIWRHASPIGVRPWSKADGGRVADTRGTHTATPTRCPTNSRGETTTTTRFFPHLLMVTLFSSFKGACPVILSYFIIGWWL
jgi:hypothetical protein